MKTSTTLLIAAGAVLAVVGVGSAVYADSGGRGHGPSHCRGDMRGPGPRGPGMRGPGMQGQGFGPMHGSMHGPMPGHGPMGGHFAGPMGGPMGGMMGPMIITRVFELADTDKDGKLTQEEIDTARTKRFESHDANGDGKLTLDEFTALFAEITAPATGRVFQVLDPDGDAAITMEEFEKPSAKVVEKFDRNGDGVLSRDDRGFGPGQGSQFQHGPMRDGSGPNCDGSGPKRDASGPGGKAPRGNAPKAKDGDAN